MESGSKKPDGAGTPKRNRSLDLKSLYTNRVSEVGESKKKVSKENEQNSPKKKRKRNKKEVSLSCLEPESKKSKTGGDADGLKSDVGCSQELNGGSKGLHGISLALAENGSAFNIPKRPRGSVGRIKWKADQVSTPLQPSDSVGHVRTLNADIIKPKGETSANEQSTGSVTVTENTASASSSKSAGKVVGSNSGKKPKANSKSIGKVSSTPKLKHNVRTDKKGRSHSIGDADTDFGVTSNNEDASSKVISNPKLKGKAQVDKNGGPGSSEDADKEFGDTVNNGDGTLSKVSSNPKLKGKARMDRNGGSGSIGDAEKVSGGTVNNGDETLSKLSSNPKLKGKAGADRNCGAGSIGDAEKAFGTTANNGEDTLSMVSSNPKLKGKHKAGSDKKDKSGSVGDAHKESGVAVNNGDTSSKVSSNLKLKHKVGTDKKGKSGTSWDAEKEFGVAVNNCGAPSKVSSKPKKRQKGGADRNGRSSSIGDADKGVGIAINNEDTSSKVCSNPKLKRKAGSDGNSMPCSVGFAERELGVAVHNGNVSSSKKRRKKKDPVDCGGGDKAFMKKSGPSVGNPVSDKLVDFDEDDDDEEKLEQNAARMLSSRFDPSCTGFSSRRKSSASQKAKGSNFSVSSIQELSHTSADPDAASDDDEHRADDTSRALRPRREEDKGKDIPRKRRHFYDILPRDLEPHWFLDKKIKVFWPLDESWYFGVVNDYHPECKLYQVKYDDGDDEWIDLQEEKFKVLLFRSELPKKAKPRKPVNVKNEIVKDEMVPTEADDADRENCPDSEPIASWLARSFRPGKSLAARLSEPGKSFPRSLETPSTSQMNLPTVSSFSYENAINLNGKVIESKRTKGKGGHKFAEAGKTVVGSGNGICAVYVRKKKPKKGKSYGSPSEIVNAVAPIPDNLPALEEDECCYGFADPSKQLWSIDHQGKLRLNVNLESRKLRFQICLPLFASTRFSNGVEYFWLLHQEMMIQHGMMLPASPAVALEMLFLDASLGLKFYLLDGSLKPVIAFIVQILNLFSKSDKLLNGNKKSPVTSMRFRLSSVQDLRKHHVFEVHCFSKLQSLDWACLDSWLQRDCVPLKQLSASECTYDNIKELEYESLNQWKPHDGSDSSHLGLSKRFALGVLPVGVSKAASTAIRLHHLNLARKPGNFFISFSATPSVYLMSHLQLLMEKSVGILPPEPVDVPHCRKGFTSRPDSDALCSVNNGFTNFPNTAGSGCSWKSGRSRTISSFQNLSPTRPARSPKFMSLGFPNGPKKPRTQVQYTIPDASYDLSSKQKTKNKRTLPCKRIRRPREKRMPASSLDNSKNFELLACGANVLVTRGDKGWRECGALIVLEVADHKEWRLTIKLSGVTKYSYKVNHILQPGTTNRYSHAMLWKGGKDWQLEFPDRSQWNLFKEMYEECYNRNIRAASVKNIPIPGVKLIEESDDYGNEAHFVRNSARYIQQLQTDAEMALDPLHVLYDMDSDDEKWWMGYTESRCEEISDEVPEKTMDVFEKVSYVQRRNSFTDAEIEEIVSGMVSVEVGKDIYKHWQEKRKRKGMPLIRHLQPPLWQSYQQQLKEWENAIARCSSVVSIGIQDKVTPPKKPQMFAFCLKPRNMDVPNKGSKQRSHRKYPISRYHDGRRSYGPMFGDEKLFYPNSARELVDFPPSYWSPRDIRISYSAASLSRSKRRKRFYTNKRRKVDRYPSNNPQILSYYQSKNRSRLMPWNMGLRDSPGERHYLFERSRMQGLDNIDLSDLDDFQLRDASSAAQYALNVAKMKREKARRLFERADAAVHKAAVALMTADAIKSAFQNPNGDGGDQTIVLA